MKKQYISPLSQVIVIDDEDILVTSPGFSDGTVDSGDAKAFFFNVSSSDFLDDNSNIFDED